MYLISHRGNLNGPDSGTENLPEQVDKCLSLGIECEIDLRYEKSQLYLGHDTSQYQINLDWLNDRSRLLWIHCKDTDSLFYLTKTRVSLNFFWHDKDKYTLTSKGYVWSFPGAPVSANSIAVLPENWWNPSVGIPLKSALGICTDFPLKFRKDMNLE